MYLPCRRTISFNIQKILRIAFADDDQHISGAFRLIVNSVSDDIAALVDIAESSVS